MSNVRVILDCTDIRCKSPSLLTLQSETFSTYKNHITFKALIGISSYGVITFVSKLFTGSVSDQEIKRQSGILRLLEPGDVCMADKGFVIDQMLVGASLIQERYLLQQRGHGRNTNHCSSQNPGGASHQENKGILHLGNSNSSIPFRFSQSAMDNMPLNGQLPRPGGCER